MVTHSRTPPLDPAADAAALLRRLGFAILMVLLPLAAFLSRRSTVVLAPVGVALLILASLIEAPPRNLARTLGGWFSRPAGVCGLLLLAWAGLATAWSPNPGESGDKLFNLLQAVVLALLAIVLLPARVRASNLYLISIGIAASALLALAFLATRPRGVLLGETGTFERGLAGLAVMVWPAVAWLESRSRRGIAILLALVTAAALVGARAGVPLGGFAAGVVVYAFALRRPLACNRVVAWGGAIILLASPLLAALLSPLAGLVLAEGHALRGGLAAWQTLILSQPGSLVVGHGLDTVLAARLSGDIPVDTPRGLPFELWFELGAVGAFIAALLLFFVVRAFTVLADGPVGSGRLIPGLLAAVASAFMLWSLEAGAAFPWWVTTLAVTVIAFAAIARGQFRTSRPKARWPIGGRRGRGDDSTAEGTRAAGAAGTTSPAAANVAPAVVETAAPSATAGKSYVRMKVPTRPAGPPDLARTDRDAPIRRE